MSALVLASLLQLTIGLFKELERPSGKWGRLSYVGKWAIDLGAIVRKTWPR